MDDLIAKEINESLDAIVKEMKYSREQRHEDSGKLNLKLEEIIQELSFIRQCLVR